MSKYGQFSDTGDEYIIFRPDTPKPWINYLTNGNYCALVSQTGGGYSFVGDAGYNRILAEIPGEVTITDRPGRYIYIRDNETGRFWGMNWQPVCKNMDSYEARQGMGYTKIKASKEGISSNTTFFVPPEDDLEIWQIDLMNNSQKSRNLSIFIYVEWSLAQNQDNLVESAFNGLFEDVYFRKNAIFATKRRWGRPDKPGEPWDKYAFLTINKKVDYYDCIKENFLGMYGDISSPAVLNDHNCKNSDGEGRRSIGALQKNIILKPDQEFSFDVLLGATERDISVEKYGDAYGIAPALKLIKKYSTREATDKAFSELNTFWRKYLDKLTVKTPDKDFNISVNYWNKYQAWMTVQWSLMDSYYVGGSATYGFRDMSQHILGTLPNDLELSKNRILQLLKFQYQEGKTVHNWDKLLNVGIVTNHSDDAQWLVFAVLSYIYESGDFGFLDEAVPYYDGESGLVLEHVIRALDFTLTHTTNRGIPKRRTADWNDALVSSDGGQGESEMVANQLQYNIKLLLPVLERIRKTELIIKYDKIYHEIFEILNKHFWDGDWYIRATTDNGKPIGSKKNKVVQIDINAQTWAIMSGVAEYRNRGKKAMDSVWKKLHTKYGFEMFTPYFHKPDPAHGIISQFTPGTKENGSIFNHPISWAVIAEVLIGRPEKAYQIWKETSFMTRGKEPDVYRAEPYVYAEFVYGPSNPEFGRGSFTWTTGSASWFWRACTDYILGVRPTIDGLFIDPAIPSQWHEASMIRHFRGSRYDITIHNPHGVSSGVKQILLNGKEIEEKIIKVDTIGEYKIDVILGKK